MGDLVLKGATSGQITVTPTAVAGTNTLTLPAATGTVALTASPTFTGTTTTGAQSVGGNITFSAADAGIIFNKTGALTNSLLNDYEEGTWTPSLGGTATYTVNEGAYRKIGKTVFFTGKIVVNTIGTGSATTISGLPFTVSGTLNAATGKTTIGYFSSIATSLTWFTLDCQSGGTTMQSQGTSAAQSSVTNTPNLFQNNARVDFAGFYFTSA